MMADMQNWKVAELQAVVLWLQTRLPACRFVEATFPQQRLTFVLPQHDWLLPQGGGAMPDFFSRFRSAAPDGGLRVSAEITSDPAQAQVVFFTQEQIQDGLPSAHLGGLSVLVRLDAPEAASAIAAMAREAGWQVIRFAGPADGLVPYLYLLPQSEEPERLTHPWRVEPLPTCAVPSALTLPVASLVTDCPWHSEGDEQYAWFWLGPQILTRLCLGDPPAEFRSLIVHFMDHPQHAGLAENLIFQLNGRSVPFETSELQSTGGRVRITLPPAALRPLVLGIGAFPSAALVPGEERHLRACLTHVEMMA